MDVSINQIVVLFTEYVYNQYHAVHFVLVVLAPSHAWLCDPMNSSLPDSSSVHGILQVQYWKENGLLFQYTLNIDNYICQSY